MEFPSNEARKALLKNYGFRNVDKKLKNTSETVFEIASLNKHAIITLWKKSDPRLNEASRLMENIVFGFSFKPVMPVVENRKIRLFTEDVTENTVEKAWTKLLRDIELQKITGTGCPKELCRGKDQKIKDKIKNTQIR